MALDADEKLHLFEAAFQTYGNEGWLFFTGTPLHKIVVSAADAAEPLNLADFPFKPVADVQKASNVFDVITVDDSDTKSDSGSSSDSHSSSDSSLVSFDKTKIAEVAEVAMDVTKQGTVEWWNDAQIPDIFKPPGGQDFPPNSKMHVVFTNLEEGQTLTIVKHITLGTSLPKASALLLCRGVAYTMHHRQNPWGVKKAYHMLLKRLVGTHLLHAKVEKRIPIAEGDKPTIIEDLLTEDLLSFGDLGYQGHSNARYSPPKWGKNQWRAIMSNMWNREHEPPASDSRTISYDSGLGARTAVIVLSPKGQLPS